MIKNAPIVLFVYNRPQNTKKTLEQLSKCCLASESTLYIFADGPKQNSNNVETKKIRLTRKIIRSKKWCKNVFIVERSINLGLAKSIRLGVSSVINKYGRVIVLEDDILVSKYFLKYMNKALNFYKDQKKVMQVSGFMFPIDFTTSEEALFLPIINSWGWGTWKRSWDKFEHCPREIGDLENSNKMISSFNVDESYPYYQILKKQVSGKIDSWAIWFYLTVFLNKGVTLYPKKTLVWNSGFTESATHTKIGLSQSQIDDNFDVSNFPLNTKVKPKDVEKLSLYFRRQNRWLNKILKVLHMLINRYVK